MTVIQSAGGIIYYLDNNIAKFLLIKRHAMSGKIEWVAPKGKIQPGETPQSAALREVSEEVHINRDKLVIEANLGSTSLRSSTEMKGGMDKDITYFLMHYSGDPEDVRILPVEGYLGIFKRATFEEVLGLVYYKNMRDIFFQGYNAIEQQKIKKQFLNNI